MFFDELKDTKLERKDGKYTLGRQDYDHLFGINDVMTLTPNEKSIASLANATYLFGILGVNINSFTAVASGYLASFSGESYEATFIINEYEDYIKNELIKLCSKKIEEDTEYTPLYYYIIKSINVGQPLSEVALNTSSFINRFKLRKETAKTSNAIEQFNKVNQQNCADNHMILCKIFFNNEEYAKDLNELKELTDTDEIKDRIHEFASEKYNFDESEEKKYTIKMYEALRLYDIILHDFIIPGYLTYRGRDRDNKRIIQDSQIINDDKRLESLIILLKSKQEIFGYEITPSLIQILNMCSTDYTADMAYDYMNGIASFRASEINNKVEEMIDDYIPRTYNNEEEKKDVRNRFNYR